MCMLAIAEERAAENAQVLLQAGYTLEDVRKVFETATQAVTKAGTDGDIFEAILDVEPGIWKNTDRNPEHDNEGVFHEDVEDAKQSLAGAAA